MNYPKMSVRQCLSHLPLYVNLNDSVETALVKMERFEVTKIVVCDENFNVLGSISKEEIVKFLLSKRRKKSIDTKFLQKFCVKEILDKNSKFVMAYPMCDLKEILDIMNTIKTKYLPIVQSPWNKKLEGFIELKGKFQKAVS